MAGGSAIIYALEQSVKAYDWPVHPPHYPWTHKPLLHALDHARYVDSQYSAALTVLLYVIVML